MKNLVIIDYGSGNLHSALKAFERAKLQCEANINISLSKNPKHVEAADLVVLPGVGAFADCLRGLQSVAGMMDALRRTVREKQRPFMGICVGMQLMAERGLEHGITDGLGWIEGEVRKIEPGNSSLKIPHMGWNTLEVRNPHPLLAGIPTGPSGLHAYFVHSYHFGTKHPADQVAETIHGVPVTAMVARDNMVGTQFHPEKSQTLGLKLITNFLNWAP